MDLEPLYSLSVRTPRLELRLPTADELGWLAHVAQAGVHAPDAMPFLVPWTDPSDTFVSDFISYHQGLRASWLVEDWKLELAVFADGEPLGIQGLRAANFSLERVVQTGSWLGKRFHGQGYGTEMRAAVLFLAFTALGAEEARTEAMDFNIASQRVSEKLGYQRDGENWPVVRDTPQRELKYQLSRESFLTGTRRPPVEFVGLEACRHLFTTGRRDGRPFTP